MKKTFCFPVCRGTGLGKSLLLARANFRKAKGQTAAIFVLVLLASMLLNIWLMLAFDYKQNFERCHNRLNAEHVTVLLDREEEAVRGFLAETLKKDGRAAEYRMDSVLWLNASISYGGGTLTTDFVALKKETALARTVGRYEIVEDGGYENGVYLSLLFRAGGNYEIGDTVKITLGKETVSYTVCGFFNSAMTGSQNCGMCALLLTEDAYEALAGKETAWDSTLLSVRLRDREESEAFEAEIKNAVSAKFPFVRTLSNSYEIVSKARYISEMICSGIVSAMAFFVTVIALVVIASNTANDIRENMKSFGVLKAAGYTGRQLIHMLLLQFLGLTFAALAVGTLLSYCLFPVLNEMMIFQTGIPYKIRFLPLPCLITAAVTGGTVALAVWLSARPVKRIEPITALRQGVKTHSFKRNFVPLKTTRLPFPAALALKTALSEKKQNITVCITMAVLSLIAVFSGVMLKNVILDKQPMIALIVGETADLAVSIAAEQEAAFVREMEADRRVEKLYLYNYSTVEVRHVRLNAVITDDCGKFNNQKLCVEGRFPKYENEVALGAKYAKEQGLKLGDEIILTADGKEAAFLLCGLTQTSNYLGKDCLMLQSGYERMGKLSYTGYYIDMAEGADADVNAFCEELRGRTDGVQYVVNVREAIEGTVSVYVSIMSAIVAAIVVLSVMIIAFVLYLLVRTLLSNKRRDYGVLKALGFTTGQLIIQTALSFMPAAAVSAAVGLVCSMAVINPLTALFLSGIGVVKCMFEIPVGFLAAAGAGIVLAAFGFVCLLSLKIKGIAPRALLSDE